MIPACSGHGEKSGVLAKLQLKERVAELGELTDGTEIARAVRSGNQREWGQDPWGVGLPQGADSRVRRLVVIRHEEAELC